MSTEPTYLMTVLFDGESIWKKELPSLLPINTKIWMRFIVEDKEFDFLVYLDDYIYSIFNHQIIMEFQQHEDLGLDYNEFYNHWNSCENPSIKCVKGFTEEEFL